MDYLEMKQARERLGLSRKQAADVLETAVDAVKRWETHPGMQSARPAPRRVAQLLTAYEQGFRPEGWPQ